MKPYRSASPHFHILAHFGHFIISSLIPEYNQKVELWLNFGELLWEIILSLLSRSQRRDNINMV